LKEDQKEEDTFEFWKLKEDKKEEEGAFSSGT
jgi:hypothetical protein